MEDKTLPDYGDFLAQGSGQPSNGGVGWQRVGAHEEGDADENFSTFTHGAS